MSKKRSVPGPEENWHFDCRLEAELPEDNVIGSRFLINVVFGSAALIFMLLAGWFGYRDVSLRREITEWESRIQQADSGIREIKQEQAQYSAEAVKIDQAYAAMKSQFYYTGFMASIAKARPEPLTVNLVESGDNNKIYVRGSIADTALNAVTIFQDFLKKLKVDPEYGLVPATGAGAAAPLFDGITGSDLTPDIRVPNRSNFEVTFVRKPPAP